MTRSKTASGLKQTTRPAVPCTKATAASCKKKIWENLDAQPTTTKIIEQIAKATTPPKASLAVHVIKAKKAMETQAAALKKV